MSGPSLSNRTRILATSVIFIAYLSVALPILIGQEHGAFEAVVIKRSGLPLFPRLDIDPGYLRAKSTNLKYLITYAFGIEDYRLSGMSEWMESDCYSIDATTGTAIPKAQMTAMLRDMLMKRFQLKYHYETRDLSVFALVVDKKGSKLAPLGQSEYDSQFFHSSGDRITRSIGSSIQDLVHYLNSRTGVAALARPVIDRTGLQGLYKIHLTFDVEVNPDGRGGRLDIHYPSALTRQLGLKLDPTKANIDIFVIDAAAKPKVDAP